MGWGDDDPPPSCKSLPFTIELSLFHAAVICFIYGLNNFILSWALKLKWMDGRDLSFFLCSFTSINLARTSNLKYSQTNC